MQCLSWEYMATPKCVMLFLVSTSKPCPHAISIWGTLPRLFTVDWKNIFSIFFFKFYLATSYHKSLSAPSFHDCVPLWGTVSLKYLTANSCREQIDNNNRPPTCMSKPFPGRETGNLFGVALLYKTKSLLQCRLMLVCLWSNLTNMQVEHPTCNTHSCQWKYDDRIHGETSCRRL